MSAGWTDQRTRLETVPVRHSQLNRSTLRMPNLSQICGLHAMKTWVETASLDGVSILVGVVRFLLPFLFCRFMPKTNNSRLDRHYFSIGIDTWYERTAYNRSKSAFHEEN